MGYGHFSIHLRRYTLLSFIFATAFLSYLAGASAQDQCPKSGDHSLVAEEIMIFTAYQTAFDGYEVVCSNKCLGKTSCMDDCQKGKANQSLKNHMGRRLASKGLTSCQTLSQLCQNQCQSSEETCQQICKPQQVL